MDLDNGSLENEQAGMDQVEDKKPAKKKKKTRFWGGFFSGILITLAALFLFMAGGVIYLGHRVKTQETSDDKSAGQTRLSFDYQKINSKIATLKRVVDRYFLFDSDLDEMETGIYRGMIDALGDPYTVYYTPEEYNELTEETEGSYCGIGALVSQDLDTGIVTILHVFADSPAEEAGIVKGDILYKANGIEASTMDLDLLVNQEVRGEEGTTVDLVILRDGEELKFTLVRRPVDVETVSYQLLSDGKTGYILVAQFDIVTDAQFKNAVDELESEGMTQLIIDMRDNPGGVLDTAVSMAAYILPDDLYDGTLVYTLDKNGRGVRYYSSDGEIRYEADDGSSAYSAYPREDGHETDIPIAVLVNGNSASAAEFFSGALRDYGRAVLVGTNTYGKGVVQSLIPLDDGSCLKITISNYYTPSGYDLNGVGLEPDLEVEYEIPEDLQAAIEDPLNYDNQLAAALELLNAENGEP